MTWTLKWKWKWRHFWSRKASGNIAKNRLRALLISDRVCCCPSVTESICEDLIRVLAKYAEVDTCKVKIDIIQVSGASGNLPALRAVVPLRESKPVNLQENYDKAI